MPVLAFIFSHLWETHAKKRYDAFVTAGAILLRSNNIDLIVTEAIASANAIEKEAAHRALDMMEIFVFVGTGNPYPTDKRNALLGKTVPGSGTVDGEREISPLARILEFTPPRKSFNTSRITSSTFSLRKTVLFVGTIGLLATAVFFAHKAYNKKAAQTSRVTQK